MTSDTSNTYRFYCQVVEIIHKDRSRIIKTMCKPDSMIIETPDDGKYQLGDTLIVTGKLLIETMESNKRAEHI